MNNPSAEPAYMAQELADPYYWPAPPRSNDLLKCHWLFERLKAWRAANRLSQRQAVAILEARSFPAISLSTLQKWEIAAHAPDVFATRAIEDFLAKFPKIPAADVPRYGRWKDKLSDQDVKQNRKLRESGSTLLSIAQRFRISESAVSRICSRTRRPSRSEMLTPI